MPAIMIDKAGNAGIAASCLKASSRNAGVVGKYVTTARDASHDLRILRDEGIAPSAGISD